ncbi:MAG TPA: hydroxymethylbilane synthase [Alphaproteobacteria bacterium]|nr:hydroxymethylbilane synthase [Alphaproteobacteria bacterium]
MGTALRIGTRGSPLALAQAAIVRERLVATGKVDPAAIETVIIKTSGDRIQDRSLADIGGKGLFVKEIEEALLDRRIDLAVHSLKDLPARLPDGLMVAAVLPREDPRDALLSPVARTIGGLPHGARVGTSGPRRRAILLHTRPDLQIVDLRGNVETRLAKLRAGAADATLLAVAGLARLRLSVEHHPLEPSEMLPSGGQGAIGLETREDDQPTRTICAAIGDSDAETELAAERAFLAVIDGSCRTPVGALARVSEASVRLEALVVRPDGSALIRRSGEGPRADAAALGAELGRAIRADMPADFFAAAGLSHA